PEERMLQRFVAQTAFDQTHVSVVTKTLDYAGFTALDSLIRSRFAAAARATPALSAFQLTMVGRGPLQAKIAYHLVPTLVQSFGITVVIIFGTFLVAFRGGASRLMAMIPSLFAILVLFLIMRLTAMTPNIATRVIAATALGTAE